MPSALVLASTARPVPPLRTFTLALGMFMTPIGPTFRGVPWVSIIAIALLITLLIAELLPHHEKAVIVKRKPPENEEAINEEKLEKEFGIIIAVILAIIIPVAVVFSRRKHSKGLASTVLVPLYIYPDTGAWDPLYEVLVPTSIPTAFPPAREAD